MAGTQRQNRRLVEPGRTVPHPPAATALEGGGSVQARQAQVHPGNALPPEAVAAVKATPASAAASALSRRVQRKSAPVPAPRKTGTAGLDRSFDRAVSGTPREVPHRRRMEAAFGTDFGDVAAHVGDGPARAGLAAMSAEAAARGDRVAFRDASPSPETVAHELAHVVQQRPAEGPAPALRSVTEIAPAAAEREANAAGRDVASGRPPQVASAPAATPPVLMKQAPRKAPLEALDELLAASPVDPQAVQAAVRGLGRKDRTALRDDAGRMAGVIDAYKDGALDVMDLASRLDATLLLTIRWLDQAGLGADLAGAAFEKRFHKASAAQVREVAASDPEVEAMITNAPDLGPLQAKAIARSGTEVAASLKDPPTLVWAMKSADGLDVLAATLPKGAKKTLKTDHAALEALLAFPETIDQDAVPLLKEVGLTPPQAVPRLAAAGSDARMAAPTFPEWFLADTKRKDLDKFVDSADLDALKAAAPAEVPPLDVQAVKAPESLGSILHDRRAFQDWVTEAQGWATLLEAIATNASAGMVKALAKSGGNWQDLLADIRAQREGGEADAARTALDALFAATPNGNLETMKQLFEARFGVQVGSGSDKAAKERLKGQQVKEKAFDAPGLRHIYEAFRVLPPSQAEAGLLTMMTRHRDGKENTSGFAFNADPHLSLEYKKGSTEAVESGDYTHEGDVMRGMNMLDTTAVHELGHKVDSGEKYSGKASFKKLAEWKVHSRGRTLIRDLQAALSEPLGDEADLSKDDKALLVRGAEHASTNRRKNMADAYQDLMQAYTDLGKREEPEEGDNHQDLLDLWAHAKETNLFRHVIAGHEDRGAWWQEPFAYLAGRQFHEAYSWESGWWSYDNTARDKKLSIYQFRNPMDHFAELYATYWCSRPVGSRVPEAMKTWFEGQGLNK